jgi:hypothetical protein
MFEKISELFIRIGRSSTTLEKQVLLFPESRQLQDQIFEYLIVIVKFCRAVVSFSKKSFIGQIMAPMSSLDKEFRDVERDLDIWAAHIRTTLDYLSSRIQIDTVKSVSHVGQNQAQVVLQDFWADLCPIQAKFDMKWRRERKRGSVRWVFEEEAFKNWRSSPTSSGICTTGKLGSGKTVTMANIVATLPISMEEKSAIACFFCNYLAPESLSADNMAGSIALQLIRSSISEDILMTLIQAHGTLIHSIPSGGTDAILKLLYQMLPDKHHYYIIIGALCEVNLDDIDTILKNFGGSCCALSHPPLHVPKAPKPSTTAFSTTTAGPTTNYHGKRKPRRGDYRVH